MSTKSRQVIYGGRIVGAKIRADGAREAAQKAVREADRAAAELWSIQMEAYGGPAQPSPTIAQCLNGAYPRRIWPGIRLSASALSLANRCLAYWPISFALLELSGRGNQACWRVHGLRTVDASERLRPEQTMHPARRVPSGVHLLGVSIVEPPVDALLLAGRMF
jgi:hypothetical protein